MPNLSLNMFYRVGVSAVREKYGERARASGRQDFPCPSPDLTELERFPCTRCVCSLFGNTEALSRERQISPPNSVLHYLLAYVSRIHKTKKRADSCMVRSELLRRIGTKVESASFSLLGM
jgi:hypothetical protein